MRNYATYATNDDLFVLAKNSAIPQGSGAATTDKMVVYVNIEPKTISAQAIGSKIGGTSSPNQSVQPAYFPFATLGAECAAIVSSLNWADNNLATGYEYLQLYTASGTFKYFVSGVLTSSQTDFNDPFEVANGFVKGACWAGSYSVGVNPF